MNSMTVFPPERFQIRAGAGLVAQGMDGSDTSAKTPAGPALVSGTPLLNRRSMKLCRLEVITTTVAGPLGSEPGMNW